MGICANPRLVALMGIHANLRLVKICCDPHFVNLMKIRGNPRLVTLLGSAPICGS